MASIDMKDTFIPKEQWTSHNTSTGFKCSYCRIEFIDVAQQREHYKLDWHRYNLKQNLLSREPITEEEFIKKADDVSSISGSESEKEDNIESVATAQGKILIKNSTGLVFAIYRCLLFDKREELEDSVLLKRLEACVTNRQWTVIMLGGGHFAGGVFQEMNPVLHKTFHCYTVRAGQGSSQTAKDSRSGGFQPKSAGASLRRYNEVALVQHVRDIIETWKDEIAKCSLIIYRAAGPYNKSVLFGGKTPPLDRSDPRLKSIPFSTRRATFTELKRVHSLLTTICTYDSVEKVVQYLPKQESLKPSNKSSKSKPSNIDRAKERETVERPLPVLLSSSSSDNSVVNESEENSKDQSEKNVELSISEQEISLEDNLQTFNDSLILKERKQHSNKKCKKHKSRKKSEAKKEALRKKEVYEFISLGDIQSLESYLQTSQLSKDMNIEETTIENLKHQTDNVEFDIINEVLDDKGNTLLHVAAIHEQSDVVKFLLDQNANPCCRNDKHETPYGCTLNVDVRTIFRDFAQDHPEKYNYNKAHIPLSSISSEEKSEKKRLQRKAKREKEKEKKKQNIIKKNEDLEKERFLQLSDREKRALAAERRILNQHGVVIARCFLCASDISGRVPFEYSGNRFCSVECLKAHRLKCPIKLTC